MTPGIGRAARTVGAGQQAWRPLDHRLPVPPDPEDQGDILWQQLAAELGWYDRAATRSRVCYQVLKVAAILAGAVVTVLAAIRATAVVTAGLAATVVVIEGAQQVFQFHANWINYRVCAETLRQHALQYAAKLPPYDDPATRRTALAQALHDATATERGSWTGTMRQAVPPSATSQNSS